MINLIDFRLRNSTLKVTDCYCNDSDLVIKASALTELLVDG
jgi:hypothetical protein